jgi:hypothetical protein
MDRAYQFDEALGWWFGNRRPPAPGRVELELADGARDADLAELRLERSLAVGAEGRWSGVGGRLLCCRYRGSRVESGSGGGVDAGHRANRAKGAKGAKGARPRADPRA